MTLRDALAMSAVLLATFAVLALVLLGLVGSDVLLIVSLLGIVIVAGTAGRSAK